MQSISFEYDVSELERALEAAARQFPASSETALKKESKSIAKDLKGRVNSEAKGHHYISPQSEKKPKPLAKSFRQGKVIRSGNKVTVAVTTVAPHYGHDMVTHKRKNKRGKGMIGSNRKVGEVKGKKTVAKYMAQRADHAELIGQELLDEILREAGLDT